jgi:manganese/iron transport system permease protein
MIELLSLEFIQRAILASVLGGIACGIVGVWVIQLNIPFVGVAISHSAFAGAVLGLLFNINPLFLSLVFCCISSLIIGPIADKSGSSPNISIGIIFSMVMGIAFLGMGLLKGPKSEALNFMWGNILMLSSNEIKLLIITVIVIFLFLFIFYKEILAVLFNREIARAVGIPEKVILYGLLFICGLTVTVNLSTIGGLLIFSLITQSPLSAYQMTYKLRNMYILSSIFGVISCLLGLFFSYILNVPSGAIIVIVSSIIFIICMIFSPKRRVIDAKS